MLTKIDLTNLVHLCMKRKKYFRSEVNFIFITNCVQGVAINISGSSIRSLILSCVYSYKHRLPEWLINQIGLRA